MIFNDTSKDNWYNTWPCIPFSLKCKSPLQTSGHMQSELSAWWLQIATSIFLTGLCGYVWTKTAKSEDEPLWNRSVNMWWINFRTLYYMNSPIWLSILPYVWSPEHIFYIYLPWGSWCPWRSTLLWKLLQTLWLEQLCVHHRGQDRCWYNPRHQALPLRWCLLELCEIEHYRV